MAVSGDGRGIVLTASMECTNSKGAWQPKWSAKL